MSELKAYKGDVTIPVYGTIADTEVYLKKDVDKTLAEKDKDIAELKQEIERLKQENEMTLVGVNLRSPTSDGRLV